MILLERIKARSRDCLQFRGVKQNAAPAAAVLGHFGTISGKKSKMAHTDQVSAIKAVNSWYLAPPS